MYNDELSEQTICIDCLFLDPNNPRFWSQQARRQTPDSRTPEGRVQNRVEQEIRRHGIEELQYSILRNGFLPLDRIVVRPLNGVEGKFVVVEGNRRLAALKLLRQRISENMVIEDHISDEYLEGLFRQTNNVTVLVYEGSDSDDISWILQGIRHIGGIRDWEPAQRAKLVADQVDNASASFTEAGQKFGLSARAVGRLYRSHKALEQMRQDDEYGNRAQNNYFSLFEEAYRNPNVRAWLGWNETNYRFDNLENLRFFYSWITPDDEDEPEMRRRIHNPKHVKYLGMLIEGDHRSLISKVDAHEIGIETAGMAAEGIEPIDSWKKRLLSSLDVIKSLPAEVITNNPREYRDLLIEMINEIERFRTMADALVTDNHEAL